MSIQLVTGGAGFIGSAYVLAQCALGHTVINLDKLTYSGNMENLKTVRGSKNHVFIQGDIGNAELVNHILTTYQPDAVVNFAAETHVDRSIHDPEAFVKTNVMGTATLLRVVKNRWLTSSRDKQATFRFLHVSTDEVYGSLSMTEPAFTESTAYSPNSPYSASKASSDHFVRAFNETYGLPTLITNCSNNYGPRQFPEKLIPLIILNALSEKPLPIYGKGENVRDWLHVEDHCEAIALVLAMAKPGETYNIGGLSEKTNISVVKNLCSILDELKPRSDGSYADLITYVTDRPGHDFRYAIDITKIKNDLSWQPKHNFETGLRQTVQWYLDNQDWVLHIQTGDYRKWLEHNYNNR